jgi:hypothetical protein
MNDIRRRETPHVKETTEEINNKIYNNEEDVTLRTGIVPDREPYVLVDHCKRYAWSNIPIRSGGCCRLSFVH